MPLLSGCNIAPRITARSTSPSFRRANTCSSPRRRRRWESPAPGKLYVVGDPKQSIYRFRRADARLFRRVCRKLTDAGAATHQLKSSTRSTYTLQEFVNAVLPSDPGLSATRRRYRRSVHGEGSG
jgi:superfamily I DNA/RNA helicase